jgi:hypothetical protein
MPRTKLTIEHCRKLAEERGGKCLESEYTNSETKMRWMCKYGHIWATSMNSIGQGRWCYYCGHKSSDKKRSKNIDDCHNIAKKHGGKCLSDKYINNSTDILWECCFSHKWTAKPVSVFRGSWCPDCAGSRKLTMDHCHEAAAKHGGKCLSTEYVNAITKMEWECASRHKWFGTLNVVRQGCWCLDCGGSRKKTIEDCNRLALKMGGKCLSTAYVNGDAHLVWQCAEGHEWKASFGNVSRGTWCGRCKYRKMQIYLAEIISSIIGIEPKQGYKGFGWLKTKTGGTLEIDIWVPELKLAIEYDGEQHFKPVRFGGMSLERASANFKEQLRRDRLKNRKVRSHKDDVRFFVRFSYKDDITEEFVREKLVSAGVCKAEE